VYTGPARVVRRRSDLKSVRAGDVLIAKTTSSEYAEVFHLIGAIVTDRGGVLSHAAVVAMETNIPAVVGTREATAVIHDGDMVTVDATAGTVIVHRRGRANNRGHSSH
jgi:phosphohistidine swiveling domain-containing protein